MPMTDFVALAGVSGGALAIMALASAASIGFLHN
jgi:hypothetical protein